MWTDRSPDDAERLLAALEAWEPAWRRDEEETSWRRVYRLVMPIPEHPTWSASCEMDGPVVQVTLVASSLWMEAHVRAAPGNENATASRVLRELVWAAMGVAL